MSNNNGNNNNSNNINFSEAEEVKIVNIGREGISYSELKKLHSLSMQTLNNLFRILATMTMTMTMTMTTSSSTLSSSSSSTITPTLFSSKDIKISIANRNFLILYNSFKESCRACNYFEHSFKNCPNIRPEFQGDDFCLNCWGQGHLSINCEEDSRVVPYNENFLISGESRPTSGSLAAYDNFNYAELYQFRKAFFQEVNDIIADSKPFSALTLQVKYFAECVEKLTNTLQRSPCNESLPYSIPGSSWVSSSQEEPIILSSDEDIKIKVEKFTTNEMEVDSSKLTKPTKKIDKNKYTKETASKMLSKRSKKKASVQTSSSSSSSDNSSSSNSLSNSDSPSSSDDSSGSGSSSSSNNSNVPLYFKKKDMPKSLREALRKRIKRRKVIKHLQLIENPLIRKFKQEDLKIVCDNNIYHSLEDSETDAETGKRIIMEEEDEEEEEKKEDEKEEEDKKEEEVKEVVEKVEETVLLTSTNQLIDQNSDDEYLMIDDGFQES
ncbi:hypothetical protein C1646_673586 [Rhizophagus diaphanus]|nr:hypothetical protein C1646_673586 [Rhizophagus diaphanus] [Rhizophagus sp. MUCL 43196]